MCFIANQSTLEELLYDQLKRFMYNYATKMIWKKKKTGPSLSQFCLPMDLLLTVDAYLMY